VSFKNRAAASWSPIELRLAKRVDYLGFVAAGAKHHFSTAHEEN
jgi:hypothetical protein